MYINPLHAIQEGWIKFPEWMDEEYQKKCVQPNALDITLDHAYDLGAHSSFILSEEVKQMRVPTRQDKLSYFTISPNEPFFMLKPGSTDVMSDFFVTVPTGVAAFLIVRSTLNRNGLWITSGLYDTSFSGNIGFVIHNDGPNAFIAPHTRVAQLVFVQSDSCGEYAGGYNTLPGQHWTEIVATNITDQSDEIAIDNTESDKPVRIKKSSK